MRNPFITLSFVLLSLVCFGNKNAALSLAKEPPAKGTFAHHFGEFHVTPSADYFFYVPGKTYEDPEPYEFQMPFIGFDMGGEYGYRPCELFAVSAGLAFRMQGYFYRHTNYFLGNKYVDYRSMGHIAYLQVPIMFHLFKQMQNSTFEFATGPQFNFPVLQTNTTVVYNPDGEKVSTDKDKIKRDAKFMRDYAMLGWTILLGAQLNLCAHADMFIGPQINFLNIAYFRKEVNEGRRDDGYPNYGASLGLKLGFRFHCEDTQ